MYLNFSFTDFIFEAFQYGRDHKDHPSPNVLSQVSYFPYVHTHLWFKETKPSWGPTSQSVLKLSLQLLPNSVSTPLRTAYLNRTLQCLLFLMVMLFPHDLFPFSLFLHFSATEARGQWQPPASNYQLLGKPELLMEEVLFSLENLATFYSIPRLSTKLITTVTSQQLSQIL